MRHTTLVPPLHRSYRSYRFSTTIATASRVARLGVLAALVVAAVRVVWLLGVLSPPVAVFTIGTTLTMFVLVGHAKVTSEVSR